MLKCLGCGKEFLYAAKKTIIAVVHILKVLQNDQIPIFQNYSPPETIEVHCCPFCQSLEIAEVEKTEPRIESIQSVKICEADDWIKKGYEVANMYQSTVTLVKKAKEEIKKVAMEPWTGD